MIRKNKEAKTSDLTNVADFFIFDLAWEDTILTKMFKDSNPSLAALTLWRWERMIMI